MKCNRCLQNILIGLIVVPLFLLVGCSKPISELYPPSPDQNDTKTVYIVNAYGNHSGIVIPKKEADPYMHVLEEFEGARYLEIGWGDASFYPAGKVTFWLSMKAALWPTDAVLHVVGLQKDPLVHYSSSNIVVLELSKKGFIKLLEFIDKSFTLDENGEVIKLGKGLYGESWFYQAEGTFYLFNNCNDWSADAIRASGFPISTFYVFKADNVMYQLRKNEP